MTSRHSEKGKGREVAEMAKKVMKKLKEEVESLNCQSLKMGRKEQDDSVLWFSWRTSCVNSARKECDGR